MTARSTTLRAERWMRQGEKRAEIGPTVVTAVVLALCVGVGYVASFRPDLALLIALVIAGLSVIDIAPAWWLLAALVGVFLGGSSGLFGADPGAIAFLHIPLVWVGFAVALVRARRWPPLARVLLGTTLAFVALTIVSWAATPSEPARLLFYLTLVVEPFAAIAALVLCPPNERQRRAIVSAFVGLLLLQVPVAVYQAMVVGPAQAAGPVRPADLVTGTLVNATNGAHILGGLSVLGIAVLLGGHHPRRWLFAPALALLPFLTDSKQVLLALPLALVCTAVARGFRGRAVWTLGVASLAGLVVLLAAPQVNQGYLLPTVDRALSGEGGKPEALSAVLESAGSSVPNLLIGVGPAQTVSHTAILTVDQLRNLDAPIRILDLEPATVGRQYVGDGYYVGSFESPRSSGIGMLGDVGILGLATYLSILFSLFLALRFVTSPEAIAASIGIVLLVPLGAIANWWEEGLFTVPLATLVGLALAPTLTSLRGDGLIRSLPRKERVPEHAA